MGVTRIENTIENICANDIRYNENAYHNIFNALSYCETIMKTDKNMTAKELATGYRDITLSKYGPLALEVLNHWGIYTTRDIGNIVFNLVNANLLGSSKGDKIEDFNNVFDLYEEMKTPYLG
jgi:uncharacterized repeat protein (TIGR04138 family)